MDLSTLPAIADRLATERGLVAELSLREFRGLKLASLRCGVAASFPVWLEAQSVALPNFGVWLALLAEGFFLALAASYAAMESRWARRAAQIEQSPTFVETHPVWTDWDELRSAFWYTLAIVSLIVWFYVGFGRPLPASLRSALTALAATLFLLVVVAETAAHWHSTRRRSAGGSDAPPLDWIGQGDAR